MMGDGARRKPGELALKIGVVGAIGVGAVLSGLFISRRGRHLLREAWQGRRRSRLEDRVLDTLWGDPVLGRREIEVEERPSGTVILTGEVRSGRERRLAVALAREIKGVNQVTDEIVVRRPARRANAFRSRRRTAGD
jgi:hypothetical protein